jgi:DNA-binding response OmpR family regulator
MDRKRILIVEGDSDTRLAYHIILKVKHYETFFAKDPLSALWEAHKHRPDLIIMDIGLCTGDGFRAMEQLKAESHLAEIPIIVISGGDANVYRPRALKVGASVFLEKPVDQAQMVRVITELIGESIDEPFADDSATHRLAAVRV